VLAGAWQKTYGEEEITYVVCDVHSNAHIGEMEAVAQSNQGERNNMVQD